ncbi:MAG: ABC transporter permease [Planctomycetes bacterium]|jgi:ABC-type transport system involved in multi-copper enzyme maturation permease subunit|nr:ABC transporter permease [Planctomycetota bacterium]
MSDAPRPGFLRALAPCFTRALHTFLAGRKAVVLVLILAVPPLLALPISARPEETRSEAVVAVLVFLYLGFLLPVVGLLFGSGIVLDELGSGALPYLFTRPSPRSALFFGKWAAALLLGAAGLSASLAGFLQLAKAPPPGEQFVRHAFLAVLAAYPAYLSLFALLGAFTRWALLGGFFYAFGLEGFLGTIPGMVRRITVLFYARSLLGEFPAKRFDVEFIFGPDGPATRATSLLVLGGALVVFLAAGAVFLSFRQFTPRNTGRE